MASVIVTPPSLLLPSPHHPSPGLTPARGILLNRHDISPLQTPSRSPMALPAPLPRNNSNSSSNSSSGDNSASRSNSLPRKIRFAPLPDPRRAVLVTEAGEVIPDTSAQPAGGSADAAGDSAALLSVTSQGSTAGSVTGDDSDSRTETGSELGLGAKKKSKKWSKRLFGTLLKGTNSSNGTAEGSDGGSALLWRQTSRDSVQSNTSSVHELGFPLGRRKSTGSAAEQPTSGRGRAPLIGSPLTLTRSAEGGPTAPVRQQRMLNGRVYGARQSQQTNKVEEPEFVEWGYGGMGSVNSSTGGSHYARLQSSNKLSLGTEASTADEDDGSGMAWVARRRAQRQKEAEEKARKEKENEAAMEAEKANEASKEEEEAVTTDSPEEVHVPLPEAAEDADARPQTPTPASSSNQTPLPSRRSTEGRLSADGTGNHEERHFVTAVSLPSIHHHHHPHQSRSHSIGSVKELAMPPRDESPPSPKRSSETGSTTEDDDESDDEDPTEDSETEPDDDISEEDRKTALCAGVEKISRHT